MKAIIFDLDGVLVDTEQLHHSCLVRATNEVFPSIPNELLSRLYRFDGRSTRDKLDDLHRVVTTLMEIKYPGISPIDVSEYIQSVDILKQTYTLESLSKLQPDPDKTELLEHLSEHGYQLGLATNTRSENMHLILDAMKIGSLFNCHLSGDDIWNRKPHPEIFLASMDILGVGPDETLIVEDSVSGVLAARASGAYLYRVENANDLIRDELIHGISKADHSRANGRTGVEVRQPWLQNHQAADRD